MKAINKNTNEAVELFLFADLDWKAQEKAHDMWVKDSGEPEYYIESEWQELLGTQDMFNDICSDDETPAIVCESVHGPGTERFFPNWKAEIYDGSGILVEYAPFDCKGMFEYGAYDVMMAWNEYAEKMKPHYDYLAENEYPDQENTEAYIEASQHEEKYQELLEQGLEAVCRELNSYVDAIEDYAYSYDHMEEWLANTDDENWYLVDGTWYARRNGNIFETIENFDTLEEITGFYCPDCSDEYSDNYAGYSVKLDYANGWYTCPVCGCSTCAPLEDICIPIYANEEVIPCA